MFDQQYTYNLKTTHENISKIVAMCCITTRLYVIKNLGNFFSAVDL